MRPQSIVNFERLYLGGWLIGLVNSITGWSRLQAMPQVQQANAMIGSWYLPVSVALSTLIALTLWYFVARRGSAVAKWVVVVFAGLAVFGLASGALLGTLAGGLATVLGIAAVALQVGAAAMLFRPDTRAWFGEVPAA